MGRMLVTNCLRDPDLKLAAATEIAASPFVGQDAAAVAGLPPCGTLITTDLAEAAAQSDVVIDFSAPEGTVENARTATQVGCAVVVGTTGLKEADKLAIAELARTGGRILMAPNMSVGVNLLFHLCAKVAPLLGADYDIEVVEMHHRHKVDSPSGTALALGEAAAKGRGVSLSNAARRVRDGQVGPRPVGEIGFATLRGGDVVGDHTVIFAADGERVELTHKASSRQIFARGAVRAALWGRGKAPGLYSMQDVLGFAD
jgi:4-hydroxy-tetrahydrodipicolinate reductase